MPKHDPLNTDSIFGEHCERYRYAGFYPRPVTPNSKSCHVKNWQIPDPLFQIAETHAWRYKYARYGIGLLMGSPFPDGTRLGAIDIDNDRYVAVISALLGHPKVGKIGSRGATYFVRVKGVPRKGEAQNPEFRVRGNDFKHLGKVVECLFDRKLCVIPPTIHPTTEKPFRWIDKGLLEASHDELPIVEFDHA